MTASYLRLLISAQKAESADAEANVADRFGAEAFFPFSQDFDLGNMFEFVAQSRLKGAETTGSVGAA